MIVKNEAAVISRCLDSVLPLIDRWVIVDTGSTDGTQDLIRNHLREVPGELLEKPWRDFGTNRSEALALAEGKCDYTLIIDADDVIEFVPGRNFPLEFKADAYTFEIVDGGTLYRRIQLVRSALPWHYEGLLHEFVTCKTAGPAEYLGALRMLRNHDGARHQDPETYRRDAALLEAALQTETRPFLAARYRFYLAQSYYDCQEWQKSLENYLLRAKMGFWQEEVFISLYRAAKIMERLRHADELIIKTYNDAAAAKPSRAEALHAVSHFCRLKSRHEEGFRLAEKALSLAQPADGLYIEPWIYEVGVLDEYGANAYWSGRYLECLDANLKVLATGKLTRKNMQRTIANIQHAREKLGNISVRPRPPKEAQAPQPPTLARDRSLPFNTEIRARMAAHPQTPEWMQGELVGPKLGIIIPYRGREEQLNKLLPHLISFFRRDLSNSKIKPLIIVSEQADDQKFNRGWCRNVGFLAVGNYCDYVCFHDVDFLPVWADYSYTANPSRIVWWGLNRRPVRTTADNKWWVLVPRGLLGGVVVVDKGQFMVANGYSNRYEGWGYEDDDLKTRLEVLGFRTGEREGTFIPLDHENEGFTETGEKNQDHMHNKKLFEELSGSYARTRTFSEGLHTAQFSQVEVDFELWAGLDKSESLLVCRLRVAQSNVLLKKSEILSQKMPNN